MSNINTVTVSGRLTSDPVVKFTDKTALLIATIAVNESVKRGNEWEEKANFFTVKKFGKQVEYLSNHLHKGTKVVVQGRLAQNSFNTKDGERRSSVDIVADNIEFEKRQPSKATQLRDPWAANNSNNIPPY